MTTTPVAMKEYCQPKYPVHLQSVSVLSAHSSSGSGQLSYLPSAVHHSEVMLYKAPKRVAPSPLDMFIRVNIRPRTSSSNRSATMLFATGSNPARQAPLSPRRIIMPHQLLTKKDMTRVAKPCAK